MPGAALFPEGGALGVSYQKLLALFLGRPGLIRHQVFLSFTEVSIQLGLNEF